MAVDPVNVIYDLPQYVFTSDNDEIQVGVWDEKIGVWSTEFIDDLTFDKSKRLLQFNTRKLAPMAYL